MHSIGFENDVQFTYVLEALVQRLHKNLYQIKDAQIALLLIDRKDKVKGSIMPVNDLRTFAPFRNTPLQVVAEGVGTVHHLLVHAADDGLLLRVRDRLVELGQPRFAVVVDDEDSFDHYLFVRLNALSEPNK